MNAQTAAASPPAPPPDEGRLSRRFADAGRQRPGKYQPNEVRLLLVAASPTLVPTTATSTSPTWRRRTRSFGRSRRGGPAAIPNPPGDNKAISAGASCVERGVFSDRPQALTPADGSELSPYVSRTAGPDRRAGTRIASSLIKADVYDAAYPALGGRGGLPVPQGPCSISRRFGQQKAFMAAFGRATRRRMTASRVRRVTPPLRRLRPMAHTAAQLQGHSSNAASSFRGRGRPRLVIPTVWPSASSTSVQSHRRQRMPALRRWSPATGLTAAARAANPNTDGVPDLLVTFR